MNIIIFLTVCIVIVSIICRPIRKATGLLFIVLGILECLSVIWIIIGIPSILIGGILYHIGNNK